MINFNNAVFIKSATNSTNFIKDDLPQIAFVGRSNVGKSSLINMLCNQNKLAKSSNKPGLTRLVNYFLIDNLLYFVDLPGYGYASGKKSETSSWDNMLNDYFKDNSNLKTVFILLDVRRGLTNLDLQMQNYLFERNISYEFIITKIDKLSKNELRLQTEKISNQIKYKKENLILTSNTKKIGKNEIFNNISSLI